MKRITTLLIAALLMSSCQKEETICNYQSIEGAYEINDNLRNDVIKFNSQGTYYICNGVNDCGVYFPYNQDCQEIYIGSNGVYRNTTFFFQDNILYFNDDSHVGGWSKI
jgi:hypothetical protein